MPAGTVAPDSADYVIVGAGPAGCVLANRLSAAPGNRVVLLEAGGPDRAREIRIPAAFSKLFTTEYDWNYHTAPQAALAGRELFWPRGKTLGGSTSINAQMWIRGCAADYDGWGVDGWSYAEVLPYFQKVDRRAGATDRSATSRSATSRSTTDRSNTASSTYGTGGPLWIDELRSPTRPPAVLGGGGAAGAPPAQADLNGPDNSGC